MHLIRVLILLIACLSGTGLPAQDSSILSGLADSLPLPPRADSNSRQSVLLKTPSVSPASTIYGSAVGGYIKTHPYYQTFASATGMREQIRQVPRKDWIFYLFLTSLGFLGLFRLAFPRYLEDIFRFFFNNTILQKQVREQLAQDALPSALLNLFFVVSAGFFLYFLMQPVLTEQGQRPGQWIIFGVLAVAVVYLVKFLLLHFTGWVTGRKELVRTYLFVVFLVNKVAAFALFLFALLLAFSTPANRPALQVLCFGCLGLLLVYRLVRSYSLVQNALKTSVLHFILAVFAFEVLPLLLLRKALTDLFL